MSKEYCREFLTREEANEFIKTRLGGAWHFKEMKRNKQGRTLVYYCYKN